MTRKLGFSEENWNILRNEYAYKIITIISKYIFI